MKNGTDPDNYLSRLLILMRLRTFAHTYISTGTFTICVKRDSETVQGPAGHSYKRAVLAGKDESRS